MKSLLSVLLCFLLASSALAAIARTQNVSADAASASLSSTSANDVIIVFAFNDINTTVPTIAAGFTGLTSSAGGGASVRVGYKVSSGGDTSTGSWTNATHVVTFVYSGTATAGPFINPTLGTASSAILTYTGFTMTHTDGTGWILGFGGSVTASAGMNGNTTSLTNRTNVTKANGLDSGVGLSSFSSETLSVTGSGRWITVTVEIVAAAVSTNFGGFFF